MINHLEISTPMLRRLIDSMPDLLTYTENFIKTKLDNVRYNEKIVYTIINDENINKDLRVMTCGDYEYINCKVIGGVDSLHFTKIDGINILFHTDEMKMVSLINGSVLTGLRTAVMSGLALKYLSPAPTNSILIIGAGTQCFYQVPIIHYLFDSADIHIFDKEPGKTNYLLNNLTDCCGTDYNLKVVGDLRKIVNDMDVILTITPSRKPILFKNQIKRGAHISALGSDSKGKQEIDLEIIKASKFVVDDVKQSLLYGELNASYSAGKVTEKSIYGTLFEIIAGKKKGRENDEETTIFDSTGLPLQDFIAHKWFYEKFVTKFQ